MADSGANGGEVPAVQELSIIDGIAELQSLDKTARIKNCSQLFNYFTANVFQKYSESDEIHLIVHRYDVPVSLKSAKRVRRQGDQDLVYSNITQSTHIGKVKMKRHLSHCMTKMEPTGYVEGKTLQHAEPMESVLS